MKEGGTSLTKTFREINLAFKVLNPNAATSLVKVQASGEESFQPQLFMVV